MVDRTARDRYAELLRHFAAGNLTNDEYEKQWWAIEDTAQEDPGLWQIFDAVWYAYDDMRTHRLRGKWALPHEGRRQVARCILFLYSDLEYEWPVDRFQQIVGCLLGICTLGLATLILNRIYERQMRRIGNRDVWPFIRESDFHQAKAHPRLLTGGRS